MAFEREALPWIDDVYRFALSLTREESDADDVVQETYLRAYRSWHTFSREPIVGAGCSPSVATCSCARASGAAHGRPRSGERGRCRGQGGLFGRRERGADDIFARLDLAPAIKTL